LNGCLKPLYQTKAKDQITNAENISTEPNIFSTDKLSAKDGKNPSKKLQKADFST